MAVAKNTKNVAVVDNSEQGVLMARKIYVDKGRISFFSLPFITLFVVATIGLFAFFGVLALVGAAVLGCGASVLRRLFSGKDKEIGPRIGGTEGDTITLGEDDYKIRDID